MFVPAWEDVILKCSYLIQTRPDPLHYSAEYAVETRDYDEKGLQLMDHNKTKRIAIIAMRTPDLLKCGVYTPYSTFDALLSRQYPKSHDR
jgi:hypothetical protein